MRKSLKYIFVLCLFIVFGAVIGFIFSNNELINIFISIRINPFVLMVMFLLATFFSTSIHEMMHAIYFVLNRIKLRYVSIFVFCLYKSNSNYRFRININNISLFSGIVIPEIPAINSEKEFKRIQKIYSESLLVAPLVSFLESLLLLIALLFTNDLLYIKAPELFCFILFNIFISMIIFITSFTKTESVYGDFPAFKYYRFDDKFAATQLMQYMFFNTTWEKDILASEWLIDHIMNQCRTINCDRIAMSDIDMLDLLLNLNRMNFVVIDNKLAELLSLIFESDLLFSLPANENRNVLFYHLFYFLYSIEKFDKAYLIDKYEIKKEKICFTNKRVEKYYQNLTKHIIFKENKFEWLVNNISPNSTYDFLKIFESVKKLEACLINQNDLGER